MNIRLDGRVALVTGAARGIGLAIARQLAVQGAQVELVDLSETVLASARELGSDARGHVADVADEAQVLTLLEKVLTHRARIDILVNNAGISPKKDGRKFHLDEMSLADWNHVLAVNLTAMFLLGRACAPAMKRQGGGRIVNISSQAGRGRSDLTSAHYATSKAGVIGLTRSMAGELGRHGINVSAVAPGFIETEMSGGYSERRRRAVIDSIPLKRAGSAADIASAVGFLASDAAGFVHGAVLDVNGGGFM